MRQTESGDPDQLSYKSGGGCATLFGLPFLAIGLVLVAMHFLPREGWRGGEPRGVVAFIVGGLFILGSLFAILWRGGVILDRRQGKVTQWWGLPTPLRQSETALSAFDHVFVGREVRKSKNSSYTVYPVGLRSGQRPPLKLGEEVTPQRGRQVGENVAKFLSFRLVDESMGKAIVRQADELDESLRERTRRKGERPPVPEPPASLHVKTRVVGETLSFEFPPRGFTAGTLLLMAIGAGVPILVVLVILVPILSEPMRPIDRFFALVPLLIFLVIVPFLSCWAIALSRARKSLLVEVSPIELRVTRRGLLGSAVTAIPADQLEELEIVGEGAAEGKADIARGPGKQEILARSDAASVAFGSRLSPEELAWLKAVIQSVLTA